MKEGRRDAPSISGHLESDRMDQQLLQTRAVFAPETVNESDRSVEVVWTTGASVLRRGLSGPYYEELDMSPSSIRMDRLNSGAPLLNSHRSDNLSDVIGVVERAWLDGDVGKARVRFSARDEVASIFEDVRSGVLRNLSVGYAVYKTERVEKDGETPTLRAVDWEPMEISVVPVGADPSAQVRAEEALSLHLQEPEEDKQPMEETRELEVAAAEPAPAIRNNAEDIQAAIAAERSRVNKIRNSVRAAGLPENLADELAASGASFTEASERIFAEMSTVEREAPTVQHVSVGVEHSEKRMEAMGAALAARTGNGEWNDAAREYAGSSLFDMAREMVELKGSSTRGLDRMEIAARALHSTSDFPILLSNTANKSLTAAYQAAPQTFRPLVRVVSVPDFKEVSRISLAGRPSLEKVNEGGEFKRGTLDEAQETYKIATYGKVLAVTRQTIINDDLDGLSRIPALFGRAAADLESDLVWGIINSNPTMGDGRSLFQAANHKNLASSGAALSIASVGAARKAVRLQKDLSGNRINIQPEYLVVPAELEVAAQQFLAPGNQYQASTVDGATGPNIFGGAFSLIVEPRLDDSSTTAWYMAASPAQLDMIELAYLQGRTGPVTEQRVGFDVDGLEIKVRLDVGAAVLDYRGFYKNPGA